MSKNFRPHGLGSLVLGVALATGALVASTSAQAGFLDQLFGGGTVQPSQPTYDYQAPQQMSPGTPAAPVIIHRAPRKLVVREVPQNKQRTTDLWHDKSLRVGDAIMMKDGIHIYHGPETAKHNAREFVPIDEAEVAPKKRAELVAMDTTRNDPLRSGHATDTLASGRSAAVGVAVTAGYKITDSRGNSVRYVGP